MFAIVLAAIIAVLALTAIGLDISSRFVDDEETSGTLLSVSRYMSIGLLLAVAGAGVYGVLAGTGVVSTPEGETFALLSGGEGHAQVA